MSTTPPSSPSLATLHTDRLSCLRADSPVLGFNADSIDPLHFPSPDYSRNLPPELDQRNDAFEKQSSTYYNFLSNLPANIPPPPLPPSHRKSALSPDNEPLPLPPAVIPGLHKRASAVSVRRQTPNFTIRQSSLSPYSIPPLPQHPPPPVPDSARNAIYFNSDDVGERLGALLLRSSPSPTSPSASRFPEGIPEEPLAEQLEIQKERREGHPLFMTPVSQRTLRNSSSQVFGGSASRRDAATRSQVFLGVPSIRPPLPDTPTRNNSAYLNMPPSPSSHSRSSDDSSGSALFTTSKRKLSSATESSAEGEVMSPATSPASGSFDHSIPPRPSVEPRRYSSDRLIPSRASYEHGITNRASFEHVVAGRASFESMAENRPVVVVHRYADGHERVYRYMPGPRDADGYDTEYERDDIKSLPTASRWSLGSSVVESVKTAKPGKDDGDGRKDKDKDNKDKDKRDKEREKLGKKKRLASFMSRLTTPHPYAPVMMVPGRWEDVEFVAPSPSRSRGRSIPISVRAEMMREKERRRQREKERQKEEEAERERQKERERDGFFVDEGLGGGDYVEETGSGIMMNEHDGDSHIEGEQQQYDPHFVGEEDQDQDLGYALSSSMSLPSSPTQSHVQAFAGFSTKSRGEGMRVRANSTPLPYVVGAGDGGVEDECEYECDCECECGGVYEPIVHHPLVRTKRQVRAQARADSETNAYFSTNTDANIYSDITANTDTDFETLPYRLSLSFSEPFLPLPLYSPTPTQQHQYQPTHTNSNSIESNASSRITTGSERTLPPTPGLTSPAFSTTSFTAPSSPLSSFKGYELSTSSGSWSAFNSHSNSPSNSSLLLGLGLGSGIGSKKTSRRSLGIRGFAARMLGHSSNPSSGSNSNSNSNFNFNIIGDSSPSRSRSRSPSSSPIVNPYLGREHEDELTPFPFYRGSGKKKEGKERKKEKEEGKVKEKRKLVISGIEDGEEVAVRRWCEAFGEVKVFERRGKGCLVVDFRKASVADTVCRVQAQVYIRGAGSVNLSWFTKTMMKKGEVGL